MVKFILIFSLLVSLNAAADIFDFGSDGKDLESKLPALIEKLKKIKMKDDPVFEESFNQGIKSVENAIEAEKLFCAGESTDAEGKTIPPAQKQLCMRELKKHYIEGTTTIFELKKKYLGFIHQRQIEKLTEIQKKLRADIEKNF